MGPAAAAGRMRTDLVEEALMMAQGPGPLERGNRLRITAGACVGSSASASSWARAIRPSGGSFRETAGFL